MDVQAAPRMVEGDGGAVRAQRSELLEVEKWSLACGELPLVLPPAGPTHALDGRGPSVRAGRRRGERNRMERAERCAEWHGVARFTVSECAKGAGKLAKASDGGGGVAAVPAPACKEEDEESKEEAEAGEGDVNATVCRWPMGGGGRSHRRREHRRAVDRRVARCGRGSGHAGDSYTYTGVGRVDAHYETVVGARTGDRQPLLEEARARAVRLHRLAVGAKVVRESTDADEARAAARHKSELA